MAELDAIAFGRGPGSFTGLRTACSVAQGLGFGAGVPVLPIDTLLAVAEEAHRAGAQQVVALLDARMDEVYFAAYEREDGRWRPAGRSGLGRPEAVAVPAGWALAGNALAAYGERLPAGSRPHRGPADGRRAAAAGPRAAGRRSARGRRRRLAALHSRQSGANYRRSAADARRRPAARPCGDP